MNGNDVVKVLIAGGGVAALEAALALRALAVDRVSIELLAPEPQFSYRPLAVAQPFALGEVAQFDLGELAARVNAGFSLGALASVDAWAHEVHTLAGGTIRYDALLIACGAVPQPAVRGALTFRGPADTAEIEQLLSEIEAGRVRRVAFAVPWGAAWSLPVYELALMTAAWVAQRGTRGVELSLVTPEEAPLHVFGLEASEAVLSLLGERGIAVHTHVYPSNFRDEQLILVPDGVVEADRVVALPRLEGQRIDGILQTRDGFIPVDTHGRVAGMSDVYAAGDITSFPIKQGGIAAQQADAVADAIAVAAGADILPSPFRPILRGLLLTGSEARYLRRDLARPGDASWASPEPLWWPPAKIAGRHLAPFLAAAAGAAFPSEVPEEPGGVLVEVELDVTALGGAVERRARLIEAAVDDALRKAEVPRVGDVMSPDPLVVAPEDTLGEVAEKLRERDFGSALVADYGRLVGILTSRDLLRAFAGRVHPSEARVREWMTAEPIAVSAGTTLEAAAALMAEYHVHHLPVVEDERAVGMVGMRDVVRRAAPLSGVGLGF